MSEQSSPFKDFLAGGFGGCCLVLVGQPLDTVKVRMQTMEVKPGVEPPYKGVVDCLTKTIRAEGPMGLFRGMSVPLIGITPVYALCFLGYGYGKRIFCDDDAFEELKLTQIGAAGAVSAAFTTPVLGPGERIKCTLQVQKDNKFKGPVDVLKHCYETGGMKSVTRGLSATFARDALGSFCYFASYEALKRAATPEGKKEPGTVGLLLAGGLAGMCNWSLAAPLDLAKSVLQTAPDNKYPHGVRSVFAEIHANSKSTADFVQQSYRGVGAVMARAFPANAACFFGFENAKKFLTACGL